MYQIAAGASTRGGDEEVGRRIRFRSRSKGIGGIIAAGGAIIFALAIPPWAWSMLLGLILVAVGGYLYLRRW